MRLIASIDDPDVARRILRHLGLATHEPGIPPCGRAQTSSGLIRPEDTRGARRPGSLLSTTHRS